MTALLQDISLDAQASERMAEFSVAGSRLVGHLTLPARPATLGVVCAHGWSGIRSGPHGMLTSLARELARHGVPVLRFDFRGRGESQGNGLETTLGTMADDLVAAERYMVQSCGVRNVVLLGLCSGGNVAIGTLPRLRATGGLILLSVYPFSDGDSFGRDVNRTWHHVRSYVRKALQPETWRRLWRGEARIGRVLHVLFGHFARKPKLLDDAGAAAAPAGAPAPSSVRQAAPKTHVANLRRDLPVLMIYGAADPDTRAARAYYETHASENAVPIEFVELAAANHNFSSIDWTAAIGRLAVAFCAQRAQDASPR